MRGAPASARARLAVAGALALALAALVATAVPGVFTIDECNYTVTVTGLRAGSLTVPGTGGLTPSLELAFFDPGVRSRAAVTSPIGSTAPPLWAFLALPFSFFGWRGLMALEAAAWLASAGIVFALAKDGARRASTPWIALGAYVLGGYGLEYAQAVWPHALSAFLCAAGFALAARARRGALAPAALAGFTLGLATGVRYQNVVFAFGVGLGVLLWAKRRAASSALFIAGFLLPIAACSFINHVRLGSWNPVSKGPGYLSTARGRSIGEIALEAPKVLFAKVVDFTAHPVPPDEAEYWRPDPRTGALVLAGAIKKAWLQSAPWIALALGALAVAWLRRPGREEPDAESARELRALSLPIACSLASFGIAGFVRHDGLCFNQRYFLELVPLAAVAFGRALERRELRTAPMAAGGAVAAAGAAAVVGLAAPESAVRQALEMGAPLLLAGFLLLAFWRARGPRLMWAAPALAAACVAWAAVVHAGEDVPASRRFRAGKLRTRAEVEKRLPPGRAALVVFGPWADAFGPMLLDRDLVVVNAALDRGATLLPLVRGLLATRRVFALAYRMPPPMAEVLGRSLAMSPVPDARPVPLVEISRR